MRHFRVALFDVTSGSADEVLEIVRAGFVPIFENQPGFVRYEIGKLDEPRPIGRTVNTGTSAGRSPRTVITEGLDDRQAPCSAGIECPGAWRSGLQTLCKRTRYN